MTFRLGALSLAVATALTIGCSKDDPAPPPEASLANDEAVYDLCGTSVGKDELRSLLNGNLVVVARHLDRGLRAQQIVSCLVVNMMVSGLDFANDVYVPQFSEGRYELKGEDDSIGFAFYFTADFGPHAAGEIIPYNLFDPASYVRGLSVKGFDPLSGQLEYDFEEGPLYGLVKGDLEVKTAGTSASFRAKLRTDVVAFEAKTDANFEGAFFGLLPLDGYKFHLLQTTTRAPLDEIYGQFLAGGYGISFTGTAFESDVLEMRQTITDSLFLMTQSDDGRWFWQGDYQSTVINGPQALYQNGFASNLEQNYTEYYCDEGLRQRVGVAKHWLDLKGGDFVLEDGTTIPYGLGVI